MISIVQGIYRDEKATEINTMLKGLLNELKTENEGMNEYYMDLTINHEEKREKTYNELLEDPKTFYELIDLRCRQDQLTTVIEKIENILYKDYKETPITENKEKTIKLKTNNTRAKPMHRNECMIWLGTKVKPFILEGETSQTEIAKKLNIAQNTISQRVSRVYSKMWAEYVELVKEGIY